MALNVLRQRNRQQELMDFSLKDAFEKLQTDHLHFQDWLRSMGLMSTPLCLLCQGSMTPRNTTMAGCVTEVRAALDRRTKRRSTFLQEKAHSSTSPTSASRLCLLCPTSGSTTWER
ncbi:unnamed protein product [Haemonchus placei]|uniref:Reverse transcriptase domain-containing protein n=1 Tax=Haemonchus placei TaxID=6290 RepID=A0A0N4X086_HAEPC|nr:unnamed protein product [Haemonchus placei]